MADSNNIQRFFDSFNKDTKPFGDSLANSMAAEVDKEILEALWAAQCDKYTPPVTSDLIYLPKPKPNPSLLYIPRKQPLIYVPGPTEYHIDLSTDDWDSTGWTIAQADTQADTQSGYVFAPFMPLYSGPSVSLDDFMDGCDACGEGNRWTLNKCSIKSLRLIIPDEAIRLCSECVEHKHSAMYFLTTIREKGQALGRRLAGRHVEVIAGESLGETVTQREIIKNGLMGSIWGASLHVSNCSMSSLNTNKYVTSLVNVQSLPSSSVCYNVSV